jgi:hypothetical protein
MVVWVIVGVFVVPIAALVGYIMWRDRGRAPSRADIEAGLGGAELAHPERYAGHAGAWEGGSSGDGSL